MTAPNPQVATLCNHNIKRWTLPPPKIHFPTNLHDKRSNYKVVDTFFLSVTTPHLCSNECEVKPKFLDQPLVRYH